MGRFSLKKWCDGVIGAIFWWCDFGAITPHDISLYYIDCSNAGYTKIPTLPTYVRNLNMDDNDLRYLDETLSDFSNYTELRQIELNNNFKLSGVSKNFFKHNKQLRYISMKNSGIKEFSGFIVPDLWDLDVESDELEVFDMDSFIENVHRESHTEGVPL